MFRLLLPHLRLSFKDTLRNRERDSEPSTSFYANLYDEGCMFDDDEINLEKRDLMHPTIYLTKAEKIRLRSLWHKTLIIKVIEKSVGCNYLLRRIKML